MGGVSDMLGGSPMKTQFMVDGAAQD